jgi:probable HAF family extracellular repeat protein
MTKNHYSIILLTGLVISTSTPDVAASALPRYHITDLGTLGGVSSSGLGINASGQVTGSSGTAGEAESHAFVWTPTLPNGVSGTMHDIGTLGGTQGQGSSINAHGQVTGISLTKGDAAYHAFLFDGTMHDLGSSAERSSEGNGINDRGQIVGVSGAGANFSAFLYDGTRHNLAPLGEGSNARGTNSSGQVTGFTGNDSFLWTPTTPNGNTGTAVLLGYLNQLGFNTDANAINASGQVTGEAGGIGAFHAFLYDGAMHDLGTLGGTYSNGYAINGRGWITGQSSTPGGADYAAFLYTNETGMVDLNALIDPAAGWNLSVGRGINDAGQITGYGQIGGEIRGFLLTPVPEPACLALAFLGATALAFPLSRRCTILLCLCFLLFPTAAGAAQYTITDLGALGGNDSRGWGINAAGLVTGYAGVPGTSVNGFLWKPTTPNAPSGAMHDLGTLGGSYSWGIGINDGGQIAGVSGTTDDVADHATLWTPTAPSGTSGTLHDLGTLGGTSSQATGINSGGQLTGYADRPGDVSSHAIVWNPSSIGSEAGTMSDIGSLGGTNSFGWDINASGQITGNSDTTDDAATHPFLWNPTTANGVSGAMHDLGTLGGSSGDASGINASGQVAGSANTIGDVAWHAFVWTPSIVGGATGTMLDLGTLGGSDSYGYAVSNAGHVVGSSYVSADVSNFQHAFLYTPSCGMLDLNTLIDPISGWELLDASDINDAGQITGQGLINDEYHAYLLTPIPLAGDVSNDGAVDGADFITWQKGFGAAYSRSDYDAWSARFGQATGAGSEATANAIVPEPVSCVLLAIGLPVFLFAFAASGRGSATYDVFCEGQHLKPRDRTADNSLRLSWQRTTVSAGGAGGIAVPCTDPSPPNLSHICVFAVLETRAVWNPKCQQCKLGDAKIENSEAGRWHARNAPLATSPVAGRGS